MREKITIGDVKAGWLFPVLIALAVVSSGAVLRLTAYRNFFYDEWEFIVGRRGWDWNVFMLPHWNHWSTVPIFLWKVLFVTVGIGNHVPYEAALVAVHALAAFLLYALIRRRSGDLIAFAAALTFLVLGSGADDIVWAFQVAWAGSVALGLGAMVLLEGDAPSRASMWAASACLLLSLMCSSVGVAFLVALGSELVVDGRRRRLLVAFVAPVAAFLLWFVMYDTGRAPGSPGVSGEFLAGPTGGTFVSQVIEFELIGLQATAAGVVGLAGAGWLLLPLVTSLIAIQAYRRRKIASWQVGLSSALLFWFLLIGLGRVHVGVAQATQTRYVYVGVVFLLPLVANAARELPWRGLWRPALVAVFALLLLGNLSQLVDAALTLQTFMRYENADLQTIETFRDAPDIATHRYLDNGLLPQVIVKDYLAATAQLGSPATPQSVYALSQRPYDQRLYIDRVMVNIFGDALRAGPAIPTVAPEMPCEMVDSSSGATLVFQVVDGQMLMLQPSHAGDAYLSLGFLNPPTGAPLRRLSLSAATPEWLQVPNTGSTQAIWQLRVVVSPVGLLRICSQLRPNVGDRNYFYGDVKDFTVGPGWSEADDVDAITGKTAEATAGTDQGAFGDEFVPSPGRYDLWYRVRVSSNSSHKADLLLGLVDLDAANFAASTTLSASSASTTYTWINVASGLMPTPQHHLRFQVNTTSKLNENWYIDEAALLPAGTQMPPQ